MGNVYKILWLNQFGEKKHIGNKHWAGGRERLWDSEPVAKKKKKKEEIKKKNLNKIKKQKEKKNTYKKNR